MSTYKNPIYPSIAILAMTATCGLLVAQNLTIGLQANINSARFVWNENTNAIINDKVGVGGGVYINYRFDRSVAFRTGFIANQKGAEVVQSFEVNDSLSGIAYEHYNTSDTRLNYFEMPFLICFGVPESYHPRFSLYFGIYGAILISASQNVTATMSTGVITSTDQYSTQKSAFRKNDYGILLGVIIPIDKIEIGGNYSLGFPRILRSDIADVNQYVDHRNRVFSFIIGYRIK
jgi:hypothetical protein